MTSRTKAINAKPAGFLWGDRMLATDACRTFMSRGEV